jgi:hypothetical protein
VGHDTRAVYSIKKGTLRRFSGLDEALLLGLGQKTERNFLICTTRRLDFEIMAPAFPRSFSFEQIQLVQTYTAEEHW